MRFELLGRSHRTLPPFDGDAVLAWIAGLDWTAIWGGMQWLMGLGLVAAVFTTVVSTVRERRAREFDRRSDLARDFLDSSVQVLSGRLQGEASHGDQADARLVFAHQMLTTNSSGKEHAATREWLDQTVRRIRFEQPPPALEGTVASLGRVVAAWVTDPARVTLPPSGA